MKLVHIALALIVGLAGCRQDLQPLGRGGATPVACHLIGELDGQNIRFEAGIEQQFMHTTLAYNALQLFESSGVIKPDPCEGCVSHLEITLRDFQTNNRNDPMLPDSTFQIKTYPFQLGTFEGGGFRRINLRQTNLEGPAPVQNQWSVFNVASSLIAQVNTLEASLILPDGAYTTRLISTFANGCTDTSTGALLVDTALINAAPCSAEIFITRIPSSTSMFLDTVNVQVPNPTQVNWRIGGMAFTGVNIFLMTDSFVLNEVFEVELEIISASCTAKVVERIAKNPALRCATSFRMHNIQSVDPLQAGHVRLKWTDALGQGFASELNQQPSWAHFEVTAIDTFPNDRRGLPTVLLTGTANCRLYQLSDPNSHKDLRNAAFKMAFPYKP
jgi:hypothetical protein